MTKLDGSKDGRGGGSGRKGRLQRPRGESSDLANPDPVAAATSTADLRVIAAVRSKAAELRYPLKGRVWIKSFNGAFEVHAGAPKIGVLSADDYRDARVDDLFRLRRTVALDVLSTGEGTTWPDWYNPLFALQWALGRLMDQAIEEMRLADRAGNRVHPRTFAYRIITSEEKQDALRAESAAEYRRTKSERSLHRSRFTVGGATASAHAALVCVQYARWRKGEVGFPSWSGPGGAVILRADNVSFAADERGVRVVFRATAQGTPAHECIALPKGGNAWSSVNKLLRGEATHGDTRLVWDERRKRWRLLVSLSLPHEVPESSGPGVLVVHRSVRDMLFVMNQDGRTFRECEGVGLKILHVRRAFHAQKREMGAVLNAQGHGARGHGKKRFYRPYQRVADKEDRTINTLLGQLASAVCRAAVESGASSIRIEDTSLPWTITGGDPSFVRMLERMPWSRAVEKLRCECEERGIELLVVANAHRLDACPACGATPKRDAQGRIDCESCGLLVSADLCSAWHMLKDAGVDTQDMRSRKLKASHGARSARQARQQADAANDAARTANP